LIKIKSWLQSDELATHRGGPSFGTEDNKEKSAMRKLLLAVGVAAVAVTATPSEARRHYTNYTTCAKYRHGRCVAWRRLTRAQARHRGYAVGYRFGPSYSYVDVGALPPPIVTRYRLGDNFRYVNDNGFVYVVNPHTYRVVRVIQVP
jgi:hypothetical protein